MIPPKLRSIDCPGLFPYNSIEFPILLDQISPLSKQLSHVDQVEIAEAKLPNTVTSGTQNGVFGAATRVSHVRHSGIIYGRINRLFMMVWIGQNGRSLTRIPMFSYLRHIKHMDQSICRDSKTAPLLNRAIVGKCVLTNPWPIHHPFRRFD